MCCPIQYGHPSSPTQAHPDYTHIHAHTTHNPCLYQLPYLSLSNAIIYICMPDNFSLFSLLVILINNWSATATQFVCTMWRYTLPLAEVLARTPSRPPLHSALPRWPYWHKFHMPIAPPLALGAGPPSGTEFALLALSASVNPNSPPQPNQRQPPLTTGTRMNDSYHLINNYSSFYFYLWTILQFL